MKSNLYTVYDAKAKLYMAPVTHRTTGHAIRWFADMCQDKNHQFHKWAEDYTLFQIGHYDDETATFEVPPTPQAIGRALEYKSQQEGA